MLKADSKRIVSSLIHSVHPEYLEEYKEPKLLSFCSDEELDYFIGWVYNTYGEKDGGWRGKLDVFDGFTFEEMYEEDNRWARYRENDPPTYRLKENFISDNRIKLLKVIDPEDNTWLLYSIDDNPKWEFQEKLSAIGDRYHLG